MSTDTFHFPNLADFLAEATRPPIGYGINSTGTDRYGFYGSETFAHAETLARNGWRDGMALISSARSLVATPDSVQSILPQPTIAEEGDEVMIDRYLNGDSDCWLAFPPAPQPHRGRVAAVWVHVSGTGEIPAASFHNRGAAALALIDALEGAGYRVEVTITGRSLIRDQRIFDFRCILKRAEDALELDRLAFFLMHPSVQRRFLFRLRERTAAVAQWQRSGMGHSVNLPPDEIPEGVIYFPIPDSCMTASAAAQQCADLLAAYLTPAA